MSELRPQDITLNDHLWNTFGHYETESSAAWVVRFLAKRGSWESFTFEDLNDFYQQKLGRPDRFSFNRLVPDHVEEREGRYHVRPSFIDALKRWHEASAPAQPR